MRLSLTLQRSNITLGDAKDAILAAKDVLSQYDIRYSIKAKFEKTCKLRHYNPDLSTFRV
jgi:hypothetical protein